MADEEALRKIRSVEEQIDMLNKKLSIAKQVCGLWFFLFCFLKLVITVLPLCYPRLSLCFSTLLRV